MISQNSQGRVSKQLSILITKKLQTIAKDCEQKVKIVIRDELENQHKHDIYSSYAPIQQSGIATAEYNEKHKHQKTKPYHHSGTLIKSIHGVIDGNTVKIEQDDLKYEDGTSVKDVYEWLDKGTKKSKKYEYYILGGYRSHTPSVKYVPQPRHGFKKATLDYMDGFIKNTLIPDIKKGKYLRKKRKGAE